MQYIGRKHVILSKALRLSNYPLTKLPIYQISGWVCPEGYLEPCSTCLILGAITCHTQVAAGREHRMKTAVSSVQKEPKMRYLVPIGLAFIVITLNSPETLGAVQSSSP